MQDYKTLNKLSKYELAAMHVRNGGLMGLPTYLKWTKDELISVILEDQRLAAQQGA